MRSKFGFLGSREWLFGTKGYRWQSQRILRLCREFDAGKYHAIFILGAHVPFSRKEWGKKLNWKKPVAVSE